MTVYRRPSDCELLSMPGSQQAVAKAFRDYVDAAASGVAGEELEMLGLLLELAVLHTERDPVSQKSFAEDLEFS